MTTERFAPGRRGAWLIAIWAVVTACNLFKPFHIDDGAHLEIAQWILSHPLHPMSGTLNWSGVDEPIHATNQPHLWFYLMAFWGRLFGFGEPAQHALQSLAALAGILLFHRLARRLIPAHALWATAIVFLGPAFVVGQNMMVDTPLLATWLAFFGLLVCDTESPHQTRRYMLAGLACAAAVLIKYSSLTLLPVLALSLILERRRAQAWTLLIPLAAISAWSAFNVWDYGGVHILARPSQRLAGALSPPRFAMIWTVTLGALTPLGLIAALSGRLARFGPWIYAGVGVAFAGLAAAVATGALRDRVSDQVLCIAFAASGAVIVLTLALEAWRVARLGVWRREAMLGAAPGVYLLLWVAGTSAFYVLFSPAVAARHVLLILPPVTLILISRWPVPPPRGARTFGLAATVVLSAGLCLSDWEAAAFYREEARTLRASVPDGRTYWISGHWGLQWYGRQNGLREVDVVRSVLAPGDVLADAPEVDRQFIQAAPPMTQLRIDVQPHPLRSLICAGHPSRFYGGFNSRTGPWSLTRECQGHIRVFRVDQPGSSASSARN